MAKYSFHIETDPKSSGYRERGAPQGDALIAFMIKNSSRRRQRKLTAAEMRFQVAPPFVAFGDIFANYR